MQARSGFPDLLHSTPHAAGDPGRQRRGLMVPGRCRQRRKEWLV